MANSPYDRDPEVYFTDGRQAPRASKRARWWLPVTILAVLTLVSILAILAIDSIFKGIGDNIAADGTPAGSSLSEPVEEQVVEEPVVEPEVERQNLRDYLPENMPTEFPATLPENLDLSAESIPTLDPNTPTEIRSEIRTKAATSHIPTLATHDPVALDASAAEVCQMLDDGAGPLKLANAELPVDSMTDQGKFVGLAIATECPEHAPVVEKWYGLYQQLAG